VAKNGIPKTVREINNRITGDFTTQTVNNKQTRVFSGRKKGRNSEGNGVFFKLQREGEKGEGKRHSVGAKT